MKNISLKNLFKLDSPIIIDVRDIEEFNKFNLYNSINIPYLELYNNFNNLLDKKKTYFILCETGYRSKRISKLLNRNHYKAIYIKRGIKQLY